MAGFCACIGMGGGSMVTPYLLSHRVAFRSAVATASLLNLCIAFGGTFAFVALTSGAATVSACWPAALLLGGAAVLVVPLGVATAHRIGQPWLRSGVGTVNLVSAMMLVLQVLPR